MPFDRFQPSFVHLERLIREGQHRVVPFVGAGLSVYGSTEERLPLWHELIARLKARAQDYGLLLEHDSESVTRLIESGSLIAATDELLECLGEKQFRAFIQEALDINGKTIPPAILELVCISWSLIVTTNIDEFLEQAWLARHGAPIEVATHADTTRLAQAIAGNTPSDSSILAKLHGTVTRYETWVLSRAHYSFLVERNLAYIEALKNLFLRTVFFIGYGINDDDLHTVLDYMSAIFPAGAGSYFALLDSRLKGTPSANRLLVKHGVQPIWFQFDPAAHDEPSGGYGEVLECLQLLVQAWTQHKSSIPIKLKYFPELDPDFVGREAELDEIAAAIISPLPQSIQVIGFGGEGKTSLIQKFLERHREQISDGRFQAVFGCSFYRADAGRFINDAYYALCPEPQALDIATKVAELARLFLNKPILLIADGTEVLQNETGAISNPYLLELFSSAIEGKSTFIATTRLALSFTSIRRLVLGPLSNEDAIRLLDNWGLEASPALIELVRERIGRHALSLRIFAALARSQSRSAVKLLQNLSLSALPDEADPLKANKAIRILKYYDEHLDAQGRIFMMCFSLLRRPTPFSTILATFAQDCGQEALNSTLLGVDLRPIIQDLLRRRLLIVESGSLLTTHPLIREHFYAEADKAKAMLLHRSLAHHHLAAVQDETPSTFDECLPLLDACYHAARAGDWNLFHSIFFRRINREHENYLGNTLGAWEEFLDVVLLAFQENNEPALEPAYYRSAAARALKHLGRSEDARQQYVACIFTCAERREAETSRYINNFMSLLISMGDLKQARQLAPLNLATLKWIDTDWRRLWQTEFALFSIGYLAALLGDQATAMEMCSTAEHVWDPLGDRRRWFFDYYRVHYSDLLLADSRVDEAQRITDASLLIGTARGWKETIGVALRGLSSIYRVRYLKCETSEADNYFRLHLEHIEAAKMQAETLRIPKLEVETLLEGIRGGIAPYLKHRKPPQDLKTLERSVQRLEEVIRSCRYRLYLPELQAAIAWLHIFRERKKEAADCAEAAVQSARGIENRLVLQNSTWLLQPLLQLIGINKPVSAMPKLFPLFLEMIDKAIDPNELREKIVLLNSGQ